MDVDTEFTFRYNHLEENEREVVNKLLRGVLRFEELPRIPSKMVRMFISSTFSGMYIGVGYNKIIVTIVLSIFTSINNSLMITG